MGKYVRIVFLLAVVGVLSWQLAPAREQLVSPNLQNVAIRANPTPVPRFDGEIPAGTFGPAEIIGANRSPSFFSGIVAGDAETPVAAVETVLMPTPESPATAAITFTPTSRPTPIEDPAIQALRELQSEAPGSLMGGVRNPGKSPDTSFVPATSTPNLEPTPTPALPRVGGMPTGYTMLYLMQPKARMTVERQIEALLKANLEEVYLGVLADGTFGIDFDYLNNVVRRLAADERQVTLVLYFTNGSAMRSYDRTPINVGFNLVPPDAFRAMIEFDQGTRTQYQQMVSRAVGTFDLNRSLGPRNTNVAIVMLEDNLDQESYRAMRELTRAVLGDRAEIVRNACVGCFPGTDAFTTDAIESHDPDNIQSLTSRDGFSLDGTGYELPGDVAGQQLSLNAVRQLKTISISRGLRYFGLWRKHRQGLGNTDTLTLPSERNYEVPSDIQLQAEVDMLRWGLELLTPTPEPSDEEEG